MLWTKRNRRIFEVHKEAEIEELWKRVRLWSALWASVSEAFKDCSVLHFEGLESSSSLGIFISLLGVSCGFPGLRYLSFELLLCGLLVHCLFSKKRRDSL